MDHNGHGINLDGVVMRNLYAGGQSNLGHLSLLIRNIKFSLKNRNLRSGTLRSLGPIEIRFRYGRARLDAVERG